MACSSSIYKSSDDTFFHECDVCKSQNVTSEAVSYCVICIEYLCIPCASAHSGSRLTKNHKQLKGSNLPSTTTTAQPTSPIMFCEHHKTMIVNMYCQSHDEVICNTCNITSHRMCKTTSIHKQTKHMKTSGSFKDALTSLEELKSKYDKLNVLKNKEGNGVKTELDECLQNMRQIRKDINEALDDIESTLSEEIHQVNERTTTYIESHNAIFADALAQISDHIEFLKKGEKTRDAEAMLVGNKKASNVKSIYADIISKMQDELHQPETTFQLNDALYDVVKHLRKVDTVLIDNSRLPFKNSGLIDMQISKCGVTRGRTSEKSLSNLTLSGRRAIDVGKACILGCTFMSDGHLVLCCGKAGLILLDQDFNVISKLEEPAYSVAAINVNEVVVACFKNHIKIIELFPKMKLTKTIQTDVYCYGIDVSGDEIYVTTNDGSDTCEVQILNMDGELQLIFGVKNGKYMFKNLDYVTVNKDGSKVFVSNSDTGIVTCLNKKGHVIYQYSDADLKSPSGMSVDCEGYLLVCGPDSNNVHVCGPDGKTNSILLTEMHGVGNPVCTAFRETDGCLVVGTNDGKQKSLISFSVI